MAHPRTFGADLNKWLIKSHNGRWYICPPREHLDNPQMHASFDSGIQAITTFSRMSTD